VQYAGTNGPAIIKSVNGGENWSSAGLTGAYMFATAVMTDTNCQTVFATVWDGGLKKSIDGGSNWNAPMGALPDNKLYYVMTDPANPGTVFVATHSHGVYMTENYGTNWSQVGSGFGGAAVLYLAFDPDNSASVYASVIGQGIYKIDMDEASPDWVLASSGISGNKIIFGISVAPGTNGQRILAGSNDLGVFISENGGTSWNRWNATGYNQNIESVLALEYEGQLVFLAGSNGAGVYRSNNMGDSWLSYSTGLTNLRARSLTYVVESGYAYLGSGDGAWRRQVVD
jgi:hypothetical protein